MCGGPKIIINPSILAADFGHLADECARCVQHTNWLHFDVMDGHFVPNISFGMPVLESLRKQFPKDKVFIDCHMMVSEPEKWVKPIADAGGSMYNFHYEATNNVEALIEDIRAHGMQVAVAIKPGTPVDVLFPLADKIDMALIMTVEPGFGGQSFREDMMPKVTELRRRNPQMHIEVDGGVGLGTISTATAAGANVLVAGTACFRAPSIPERFAELNSLANEGLSKLKI